jgi:hypothetical protein
MAACEDVDISDPKAISVTKRAVLAEKCDMRIPTNVLKGCIVRERRGVYNAGHYSDNRILHQSPIKYL